MSGKKTAWLGFAVMAVDFYTTFVAQNLWNWFVVPSLNIPSISYWGMYGLVLLLRLISERRDSLTEELRWKTAFVALDACVPEDKIPDFKESMTQQADGLWMDLGLSIFGKLWGTTTALAIGWGVHTFLR